MDVFNLKRPLIRSFDSSISNDKHALGILIRETAETDSELVPFLETELYLGSKKVKQFLVCK